MITGSNFEECTGTYNLNRDVISSSAPSRDVYKLDGRDRYIFYFQDKKEWRIGKKENLEDGEYFFSSESLF